MHYERYKLHVSKSIQCCLHRHCRFSISLSSINETKPHSETCSKKTEGEIAEIIATFINRYNLNDGFNSNDIINSNEANNKCDIVATRIVSTPIVSKRQRVDVTPPSSQAQGKQDYYHYYYNIIFNN